LTKVGYQIKKGEEYKMKRGVTKQAVLALFLAVLIVVITLAGCGAPAPTPPVAPKPEAKPEPAASLPPIKIGHIRALTGGSAITSKKMVEGFNFGLEQAGFQVAGRKIEVIVEDDLNRPDVSIDKARKLVENDKVAFIVGPTGGGNQMGVAQYANKVGIPNIHTNPSPIGVIMQKLQWTIQAGGAEPQQSSTMGRYAYEQLKLRKVVIMTADWAAGHSFLDAFMNSFKKLGGEIIQEQYPPLDTADYAPYLANLKDADACVAWFQGADGAKFLTQYEEFGLSKRMPLVAAFHGSFFDPYVVAALPPKVAEGMMGRLTPEVYSPFIDNAFNKSFVDAFKKKFNSLPEDNISGPYQGAMLILEALKVTNGDTTPEKLKQAILNSKIEGPEGPIVFDKEKMSSIKDIYICKVDKVGNDFPLNPIFTYKAVPPAGY
jgi:branched-chain amino acid transport system substrate-binding protein